MDIKKFDFKYIYYFIILLISLFITFIIEMYFYLHIIIMTIIWGVVALNWNLTLGFGGIFHIAQLTFMAAGGYSAAIAITQFGLSPWLALFVGGIVAVLFSILIGLPALKVSGIYLILLTYAFHYAMQQIVLIFNEITNGTMGLIVPSHKLMGINFRIEMSPYFYLVLLLLVLTLILKVFIVNSNIGEAIIASKDSPVLAKSVGIELSKYQLITFGSSAFLTGMIGAVYAGYVGVIGPEIFSFSLVIDALGMIVIGGLGTIIGPLIGSAFISSITEIFRAFDQWRPILVGLTIILMLVFVPNGIVPIIKNIFKSNK